ncbi:unnamed protein product [Candidula unifasciata]|uniref:Insulin-like domain-containing protein n=1 Tax=Candidula unifasciata TaxID=100452 RepID=A0A8S3ZE60_9EUPU|nr:unnamed protein product [Candidula unifasciata]
MIRNVEYYTTLTVALIAINLTIYQALGQSRTCSLLARPHPNGFCGERLAQAHSNVCFLLRRTYPHLFPMSKRSVPSESDTSPSVDSLLNSELHDDDEEFSRYPDHKSDPVFILEDNSHLVSLLKSADEPVYTSHRPTASAFINLLEKRNSRRKRSLVCECCYGPCTIRIIARYC